MLHANENNWAMAASAGQTKTSSKMLQTLGLIGSHSYACLGVVLVGLTEEVRLVKLRNPWGNCEWSGDWSVDSDCWTDETKLQSGFSTLECGVFYMHITDFCKHFSRVQICLVNDEYLYVSKMYKQDKYSWIKFEVLGSGGNFYFTIH